MTQKVKGMVKGFEVADTFGWSRSHDNRLALVGLKDPNDQQMVLGCSEGKIAEVIAGLIDATAAFAGGAGLGTRGNVATIDVAAFDLGHSVQTGEVVLALHRPQGGTVSFRMPPALAERLRDALVEATAKPAAAN